MNIKENLKNTDIVNGMRGSDSIQSPPQQAEQPVYFTYKDRVFRLLYKDKGRLLELYNALNDTCYTNEADLTVNTLENAIFMKMKNDVSFLIGYSMCLYEHQSTYCPNMPLRGFLYLADLYKRHIKDIDLSIQKKITIPTPHYIIFYNGTERDEEEFTQKLSESFEDSTEGCLELTVRTLNINYGHNKALMDKCRTLADYSYFIAEIRKNLETMPLKSAVITAVDTCIRKDILRDFLLEQKAEVISMSIYEYNEEYVKKTLYEDGFDNGHSKGKQEGIAVNLVENVEALMHNLNLNLERACQSLSITVADYEKAKEEIKSNS
ncbi:MAG: hypothetical protein J6K48_00580 [Lachnospiraceae bacterium]|nr:hypothetical protein [Lachnospiraceae bacterium]